MRRRQGGFEDKGICVGQSGEIEAEGVAWEASISGRC